MDELLRLPSVEVVGFFVFVTDLWFVATAE
jgi:hypothetical protein